MAKIRTRSARRIGVPALLASSVMLGLLSQAAGAEKAKPAAASERPIPSVTVAHVTSQDFVRTVVATGSLVSRETVQVNALVQGFAVYEINADVGDIVKKGDVLAKMDAETFKAQAMQAEADLTRADASILQADSQIRSNQATLDAANSALERIQSLAKSGTVSQATLDNALSNQKGAQAATESAHQALASAKAMRGAADAALNMAKLNLYRASVTAPVDGVILTRGIELGAMASAAAPLFTILKDGVVEVKATIVETELGVLNPGDSAEVTIAGIGKASGKVRLVSPMVDQRSRLGEIWIELPPQEGLRPGLFASTRILAETSRSLSIPATAVLYDAKGTYVQTVSADNVIERRDVVAGLVDQGNRQILDGLAEGDTVVAVSGAFFSQGDEVRPIEIKGASQ